MRIRLVDGHLDADDPDATFYMMAAPKGLCVAVVAGIPKALVLKQAGYCEYRPPTASERRQWMAYRRMDPEEITLSDGWQFLGENWVDV